MYKYINDNRYRAYWPYRKLKENDIREELLIASRALKINKEFIKDLEISSIEKATVNGEKVWKVTFESPQFYSLATAALVLDGDIWNKVDPTTASKNQIKAAQQKVLEKIIKS